MTQHESPPSPDAGSTDEPPPALGRHWIVEFRGCDPGRIATVRAVRPVLERAVAASGATPVHWAFHQFEPWGMSATVLITESHVCLHSWPDEGYMSADLFTCGKSMAPERAVSVLREGFGASQVSLRVLHRGARP